jgi:CMP-2-keto-3-deoxyoctulosonic acid synthetase
MQHAELIERATNIYWRIGMAWNSRKGVKRITVSKAIELITTTLSHLDPSEAIAKKLKDLLQDIIVNAQSDIPEAEDGPITVTIKSSAE